MKSSIKLNIFICVVVISLASCKSKYNIFSTYAKELKINSLIDKVENNYLDYKTISVKFQVKYSDEDKKHTLSGIYRIRKDSIIWLTMGPNIGMEFFRAILKEDSISFVNRINKTYYHGDYGYINNFTKISFLYNNIENILNNQISSSNNISLKWKDYLSKNFKYEILNNKYSLLRNRRTDEDGEYNFFYNALDTLIILPDIYKIEKLSWQDYENDRQLVIEFDNYKKINANYIPQEISVNILHEEKSQKINIKIKQMNIDKKERFPFKIPIKKYSRIL